MGDTDADSDSDFDSDRKKIKLFPRFVSKSELIKELSTFLHFRVSTGDELVTPLTSLTE